LVREQFRIAAGEKLRFTEDPQPRGDSIEIRINGEDAARNFLPAPGTVTKLRLPSGPGVRVDTGIVEGSVMGGHSDTRLSQLFVPGWDRDNTLERSRLALDEMQVDGMDTVQPFHRLIVRDPAFTAEDGLTVHTRWIETEWDNTVEPFAGAGEA